MTVNKREFYLNHYINKGFSQDLLDHTVGVSPNIGIDDNWIPKVEELHNQLKALHPDYVILQIKEKFGGLRYYVQGVGKEGDDLISKYEQESRRW